MKATLVRKITQLSLLPNRVLLWLGNYKKAINYPNTPTVVPVRGKLEQFEISNYREYIQRTIYFRGSYETRETKIIKRYLRPGDIFFDINGIGFFSLFAAPIVGEEGQVIAF